MRIFLADDEPFSIRRVTFALENIADAEIVGTAADGVTALNEIRRLKPDLVILDIEMPALNGMAVASALADNRLDIVFVTAFDRYATDAFLVEATDYLLKPLKPERLRLAIDRARRRQTERSAVQPPPSDTVSGMNSPIPLERAQVAQSILYIPSRTGGVDLAQTDIIWVEAAKDYVLIHTSLRSFILRTTMSDLADRLRPSIVRVHRSAFVAIESIRHWRRSPKGLWVLTMTDGSQISVSPTYVKGVRALLK
jgi:two-component system LytT family response regulator